MGLFYGMNGCGLLVLLVGYGVYGGFDWFVMVYGIDGKNYENGDGYEIFGIELGV